MSKTAIFVLIFVLVLAGFLIYLRRHRNRISSLPVTSTQSVSQSPNAESNSSNLPWIKTQDLKFVDAKGQTVYLRGFVTLTDNPANHTTFNYTLTDYQRMKSLGANVQSIRVGIASLGGINGQAADQTYIKKLENMVNLGQQAGIYTDFKMTMYNESSFVGQNKNSSWASLWNSSQEQQQIINDWMNIWQDFKNDPAVVGYDLLNEPEKGGLAADDNTFISNYLNPFYQKIIDVLRAMDQNHLAFFQPGYISGQASYMSYSAKISRSGTVYAPHFYPGYIPYIARKIIDISDAGRWMQRYLSEAQSNNTPIFIGEYALPWDPRDDGNTQIQSAYQSAEKTITNLFIQNNLSFSRPWYADDRAQVSLSRGTREVILSHALIQGNSLGGSFRSFITDIFSRAVKTNAAVN